MMNNHDGVGQVSKGSLTVFKFQSSAVRVVTDDKGDPWFCAKDVCTVLGYTDDSKAVKDHCKPWGITKRYLPTSSGPQELTFINQGNVYRLGIIRSYKPEAKRFEYWVYDEVLPSIRKGLAADSLKPSLGLYTFVLPPIADIKPYSTVNHT